MKVFGAFQSVAFLRSTLPSQHQPHPSLTTAATTTIKPPHPPPPSPFSSTRCHSSTTQLFSSSHPNQEARNTTAANGDMGNTNSNSTVTATATLEMPPPSENTDKVLLSDILPPLPDGSRRLYLLRHGETDWNALGKIQGGGYDIPLNVNGRRQALTTAHTLDGIPLGVIASSQLSRAKETADILFELHQNDSTDSSSIARIIDTGFAEMSFGEFEGLAARDELEKPELKERFLKIHKKIKTHKDIPYPGGGESTIQVEERSKRALFQLLNDHPNARHVAVVSHGRTNKVLLASVVLQDVSEFPNVKQSNTCINVADVDANGNWTVQTINFHEHVKDNVIIRPPH